MVSDVDRIWEELRKKITYDQNILCEKINKNLGAIITPFSPKFHAARVFIPATEMKLEQIP